MADQALRSDKVISAHVKRHMDDDSALPKRSLCQPCCKTLRPVTPIGRLYSG